MLNFREVEGEIMIKEIFVSASTVLIVYGLFLNGQTELANGVIAGICLVAIGYIIAKAPW
jgi:hypothetical protein